MTKPHDVSLCQNITILEWELYKCIRVYANGDIPIMLLFNCVKFLVRLKEFAAYYSQTTVKLKGPKHTTLCSQGEMARCCMIHFNSSVKMNNTPSLSCL